MIEDKDLGLQVAESKEEELWTKFKEVTEQNLKNSNNDVILYTRMLVMANEELDKCKNKEK
jgi:hypothetical protein